jgi:glycosyltransferase 2 family protein
MDSLRALRQNRGGGVSETGARPASRLRQQLRAQLPRIRILAGIAISVVFLSVTVAGLDLREVGQLILAASPIGLLVALAIVGLDVSVRAYRWQGLLEAMAPASFRKAFGFLCIGYFANSMLPARLGDLARAYLAGNAFRVPRLATLGTVLVERVSDGVTMVVAVIAFGLIVPGAGAIRDTAAALFLVGLAGLLVVSLGLLAARRSGLVTTRLGSLVQDFLARIAAGTRAAQSPRGAARLVLTTLAAFVTAVLVLYSVAGAVGLLLTPAQAAFVAAGLALSLAIPAAPGSVGTYEFVGVTILVGLGFPPEQSFAAVALVHLVAALPPALTGLVAMWVYQMRVGTLVESAEAAREAP